MADKFELKIMTEKERQQLEELLNILKSIRGRHTELVTVYIPSGFNKDQIVRQLEYEKSTAANIKSKQTRSAVETALDSLTRELKGLKQTPPNGLACFSGNISEKEGQQDNKTWLYEPPKPLNIRLYRCDQVFITEYLEAILNTAEVYGLLVMDRREATIGILEGKKIELIRSLQSNVPGKIKAGGQSAARYERITEDLAKEFFKKVAEAMKEIFQNMPKLKGFLIGGPIPTKEEFLEFGDLYGPLKSKVIAIKDIGYTDEHGLRLLVEASHDDMVNQELVKEKQLVQKFFETLGKHKERATYGIEKIKTAIERGAVDKLLISKKLPKEDAETLEALANNIGAETLLVSTDTEEGIQFLNLTGGAGAILRFAFE